jgi:hypothetical protein
MELVASSKAGVILGDVTILVTTEPVYEIHPFGVGSNSIFRKSLLVGV